MVDRKIDRKIRDLEIDIHTARHRQTQTDTAIFLSRNGSHASGGWLAGLRLLQASRLEPQAGADAAVLQQTPSSPGNLSRLDEALPHEKDNPR